MGTCMVTMRTRFAGMHNPTVSSPRTDYQLYLKVLEDEDQKPSVEPSLVDQQAIVKRPPTNTAWTVVRHAPEPQATDIDS